MRLNWLIVLSCLSTIAQHSASAQAQLSQARGVIAEDLRLAGSVEDFSLIARLYVSPNKSLYVPTVADASIRVYDSTGTRIGTIGRKGAGPGEFKGVMYLGWKADTLWVDDPTQRRISYFGPNLRLLRTAAYPNYNQKITVGIDRQSATIINIAPISVAPDGTLIVQAFPADKAAGTQGLFNPPAPLLARFTSKGSLQYMAQLPSSWDARWSVTAAGYTHRVPFAPTAIVASSATGDRIAHVTSTILGDSGTYTVTMIRANGDTAFVRTFAFQGVRIPGIVRDSALYAIKPREGPPDLAKRFFDLSKDKMTQIYPGAESLVLGTDNTVWIGLHAPDGGQTLVVLNGRGEAIGSVKIPATSRLRQASLSKIWTTFTDDDGLVNIVRYRVTGLACARTDCS